MAYCLDEVMRDGSGANARIMETVHAGGQTRNALHDIATRIARNREVLGVHYPSDSEAGRQLAEQIFETLFACTSIGDAIGGTGLANEARREWVDTTSSVP